MALSLILPTFDERDNVVPLLERCAVALAGVEHEVIVVDDASPDGTATVARAYAARDPVVRVIVREPPRGLTASIARGVGEARHDVIAWMDADGSMAPELLPRLLAPLERGEADLVIGSRFLPGGGIKGHDPDAPGLGWLGIARRLRGTEDSLLAVALSSFGNWLLRRLLSQDVTDWTSGFVAVRAEVAHAIPLEGDYGEYFLAFVYRALRAGYRVREVPYVIEPRRFGVSKTGENVREYARRGVQYVAAALRVRRAARPLRCPARVRSTPFRGATARDAGERAA